MTKKISSMKISKKIIVFSSAIALASCENLGEVLSSLPPLPTTTTGTSAALTNGDVISGLKEALNVGIKNSVSKTSALDGFLSNDLIRLPFPQDALVIREKAIEWGMQSQVDKFETTLNRAAEEATKEALPIFVDAITNMSIQDGFAILNGGDGAATKFLKDNTTAKLTEAFAPKVANAISTVKLTDYWKPLAEKYNLMAGFSGKPLVNADLNKYVTERAISGLFMLVEQEENKIRKDPAARVSDILVKVFGSLKN